MAKIDIGLVRHVVTNQPKERAGEGHVHARTREDTRVGGAPAVAAMRVGHPGDTGMTGRAPVSMR